MPTLEIYGVPISRSISNIWAALELGIDYENVPVGWDDNSIYSNDNRGINPNHVPPHFATANWRPDCRARLRRRR